MRTRVAGLLRPLLGRRIQAVGAGNHQAQAGGVRAAGVDQRPGRGVVVHHHGCGGGLAQQGSHRVLPPTLDHQLLGQGAQDPGQAGVGELRGGVLGGQGQRERVASGGPGRSV